MQASIVDLRYKMRSVLEAIDRGESVTVTHQGKPRAKLVPIKSPKKKSVSDHPYCGMRADDKESVEQIMKRLRKPRYDF